MLRDLALSVGDLFVAPRQLGKQPVDLVLIGTAGSERSEATFELLRACLCGSDLCSARIEGRQQLGELLMALVRHVIHDLARVTEEEILHPIPEPEHVPRSSAPVEAG